MRQNGDPLGMESAISIPSGFKYFVGAAALFIAGCSAFFSVRGLGMLFIGSATAVMIMAASLEVGKLVAASFLYRYWHFLSRPLKLYMTAAVIVLIGITSLGNYGYLARAYERTHTQVSLLEGQVVSLQKEIADTQRQIDDSRNQFGKVTDAGREDVVNVQQRITQAGTLLDQSLARLQEQRKTAQDRRDHDIQTLTARLAEQAEILKKAIASEESAVDGLNQQLAVLDRAVDAYTKQGGPGLFKTDGVKRGQELREQQHSERESIAAKIAAHAAQQQQLRAEHAKRVEVTDRDAVAVRNQFDKDVARLDADEQTQRKANTDALVAVQQQLATLQSKGQTVRTEGDTQIESLYQRIRSRNEEVHELQEKIAGTDIGSYRFVARAFDAGTDSIVKWLILALVVVFDPFAVCLAVGFNVAMLRERRPSSSVPAPTGPASPIVTVTETVTAQPAPRRKRWTTFGASLFLLVVLTGIIALVAYWGLSALHRRAVSAHAVLIPSDSFAVVTLRPAELQRTAATRNLTDWLGQSAGATLAPLLAGVTGGGFDPRSDVYLFAKFPSGRTAEKSSRPVILCGIVAQVADAVAAETALSGMADQISRSLRGTSTVSLTRNRAMIQYGNGRYMDPEGGFFSFALTDKAAVLLVEFEGDPHAPCAETEIRQCLTGSVSSRPARSVQLAGALAVWFDADRFFRQVPKNPAAQARYQQLQRHLGFDLVLKVRPYGNERLNVSADYNYQLDRFSNRHQASAVELLATLGKGDTAGIAGRLMDRCADTLDYDSLIERLRTALGGTGTGGIQTVVVEKSFASSRDAQFVLTARCDEKSKLPLMASVQTLRQ